MRSRNEFRMTKKILSLVGNIIKPDFESNLETIGEFGLLLAVAVAMHW